MVQAAESKVFRPVTPNGQTMFSLEGHSLGVAREPQGSRLASPIQPSGKGTFLSLPHC